VPCLSFCLIHPRPGPFTDFHPVRVCAVRERWRTPVNAMQHCWKACWGQPLRSSNLLSSATPDQPIHPAGHGHVRLCSLICSLIHSTHIGPKRPKGAGARFWMLSRLWPPTRATGPVGPSAVTGHRVKVHRVTSGALGSISPRQRTRSSRCPSGRRIARQPPQKRSRR